MIFSYALTMTLASITSVLVERPFLKLKDRIAISRTTPLVSPKENIFEGPPVCLELPESHNGDP
jgi:hypothetical protein